MVVESANLGVLDGDNSVSAAGSMMRRTAPPGTNGTPGKTATPGLTDSEGNLWPSVEDVVKHASADEVEKEISGASYES